MKRGLQTQLMIQPKIKMGYYSSPQFQPMNSQTIEEIMITISGFWKFDFFYQISIQFDNNN